MRERLIALRERRARLRERAAREREQVAAAVQAASAIEPWLDAARRLAAGVRQHPAWVAGGIAFVLALRPRRVLSLATKGWALFGVYRRARRLWMRFGPAVFAGIRGA